MIVRSHLAATFLALGLGCAFGCASSAPVERRNGALLEPGRRVPPAGYAYYAQGVVLEGEGQLEQAREAYRRARNADPESGAAWAGLARTYCEVDRHVAEEFFERGLHRAEERYPIYLARSRCRLRWREPIGALEDAHRALALGPDRPEASEALATAAEAGGDSKRAEATRLALLLYQGGKAPPEPPRLDQQAVDAALSAGDLDQAQTLAAGLITPGELAVRALALGQRQLAQSQVELVLAASPEDVDAHIAAALLVPRNIDWAVPLAGHPSPLGGCLYASHLATWVNARTANLFRQRLPERDRSPAPLLPARTAGGQEDSLLRDCIDHLQELLSELAPPLPEPPTR